jgi:hypothetical protein
MKYKREFFGLVLFLFLSASACVSTKVSSTEAQDSGSLQPGEFVSTDETTNNFATAEPTPESRQKAVLFDYTKETGAPKFDKIPKAEENVVLQYLFGANYKRDANAKIERRISGAFTKPNVKETLYFVRGGLIDETEDMARFESQSVGYLTVYDGTTPISKIRLFAQGIRQITDLNNDGKNELLLEDGFTNMGATMVSLWLKQIENGELQIIKEFGNVFSGNGGAIGKCVVDASVARYALTSEKKFPDFEMSYFESGCGKNSRWKRLAKNSFQE